jgi:phosphate transport system permease protein
MTKSNGAETMKYSQRSIRHAQRNDKIATGVLTAIVAAIFVLLISLIVYIIASGANKAFDLQFLTSKPEQFKEGGGIGPELFNSFYLLVLTLLISLPLSLGAAIFLVEYAPDNEVTHAVKTAIEVLASLPSIVVGLFGFLLFVISFGWGFSILSGALALTIFNIPLLVRVIQQALESVPQSQRDAGLALGLSRWETTVHILLPCAMPAIITGVILSAGRVFGEAAALIYTAGQSAPALDFTNFNLSSYACPWNIWRPAETLAVHIWKINSEGVVPDLAAVSNGSAAVLMICVLLFNLLARWFGRHAERKLMSE